MTDELITVARFQVLPEAEAARMHLEAEGIPAFLADAETVNMDWLLGNAVGYIKLQVSSSHVEAAAAVLERTRPQRPEGNDDPDRPEKVLCLSCGAVLPDDASRCPACGWSYAAGRDS